MRSCAVRRWLRNSDSVAHFFVTASAQFYLTEHSDVGQATVSLLPKSCTGAKWALPHGRLSSVASVPVSSHGAPARKPRPITLSDVSPTLPPVRVVPAAAGLPADPAADAHLARRLGHRLAGDGRAPPGAQARGRLPVPAAVGSAREDLSRGPLAVRGRFSAFGAIDFFRWAFSAPSLWTRRSGPLARHRLRRRGRPPRPALRLGPGRPGAPR